MIKLSKRRDFIYDIVKKDLTFCWEEGGGSGA